MINLIIKILEKTKSHPHPCLIAFNLLLVSRNTMGWVKMETCSNPPPIRGEFGFRLVGFKSGVEIYMLNRVRLMSCLVLFLGHVFVFGEHKPCKYVWLGCFKKNIFKNMFKKTLFLRKKKRKRYFFFFLFQTN